MFGRKSYDLLKLLECTISGVVSQTTKETSGVGVSPGRDFRLTGEGKGVSLRMTPEDLRVPGDQPGLRSGVFPTLQPHVDSM